jgi:hypothetical protein
LETLPSLEYFIKEAASVRAISDIIGHITGKAFYLEVKKSVKEINPLKGRALLQDWWLKKQRKSGAYAEFVYPENLEKVIQDLKDLAIR